MATEVKLPALGESVTEGTVTQWLKSVGDTVAVDEPLLEVSTDKVDTEIPSPVAGKLLEIKAAEDETIEVGAVLAVIGDEGESAGDAGQSGQGQQSEQSEQSGQGEQTEESGQAEQSAPSGEDEQAQQGEQGEQADQRPEGGESSGAPEDDTGNQESAPQEPEAPEPAAATSESPESSGSSSGSGGGDATPVTLPALGESVTEGTVTQWLKSVGDTVAVDEPLLEVSTDKVDTEIPSPVAGTLLEIKAGEDETVEVGAVLALVGSGSPSSDGGSSSPADDTEQAPQAQEPAEPQRDEQPEPEPQAAQQEPEETPEREQQPQAQEQRASAAEAQPEPTVQAAPATTAAPAAASGGGDRSSTNGSGDRSYVTPLVRKLAAQHNVDLSGLKGTGVGGRIRKQDVLEAAEAAKQQAAAPAASASPATEPSGAAPEPSPLRGKTEKLSRLRRVIADRMVESLHVSAQLTTVVEVDVTAIGQLRAKHKDAFEQREGVKLSFLPFFARAAIDALKVYPQVNASIDTEAGTVTYHDGEHLGIAVDTERGLLVPVIKNAGDLSIAGIARKIADLAARTRDSKINPDELSGGTFTLTNTGSRGALFDTPIINQPQVGILGTGAVVKRPVVISDERLGETIAVRQMVYLALTYDHRLVDGADAARFLSTIKQRLEEANFESELGG
jgi:pyruvate dehydrogenase E2 component (dihydrolipoamide acetyltransferase)